VPEAVADTGVPALVEHLYLHIPFCHRICPYCAFYKHTPGSTEMSAFVDALLMEAVRYSTKYQLRPKTLYLGGGTPTLLSEAHLQRLLLGLKERLDVTQLNELTLESNPRTVTAGKAKLLADCGVTRVSVGIQAWDATTLQTLGRDHSAEDALEIMQLLREAGIPSINVDLMFSIPGQSIETWGSTLRSAIAAQPDHISAYNLNYEEDTAFFERLQRGEYRENADADASHFHHAIALLEAAGYEHYETSNYAKPGHRSQHNAAYWTGRDYLGLGPSASSTVARQRWKNLPDTEAYVHALQNHILPQSEAELLTDEQWLMERVALELRTEAGVSPQYVAQLPQDKIATLSEEGLLLLKDDRLALTAEGKALVDSIAEALLLG
jgi:oxygen-independent coproporphyrinogen III oxidase